MRQVSLSFAAGILIGSVVSVPLGNRIATAQAVQSWSKGSVTPVVLVKPSLGVFVPAEGSVIGISWSKDEVVPVIIVKPSVGGFVPLQGTAIGNPWSKTDVKPVILVQPSLGSFVPFYSTSNLSGSSNSNPTSNQRASITPTASACNPAIETNIDGDFKGWEGETIYKMDDGSIWQQSVYHYHYHYAFHPSVVIFADSTGQCHIRVEDDDDDGADVVRIK